jgi:hypothetical protein
MTDIPVEALEGVADIIRMVCNKENNYSYFATKPIGNYKYKIAIRLAEVDEEKEAKFITITLRREDR